jgi:hypothetical protein
MFIEKPKPVDIFWQEYEEKTGEKVLSRGLGKYISGWDEFDEKNLGGIWGLIINTSGGMRFHHFPQHTWIDSLAARFTESDKVKEVSLYVSNEKIISVNQIKETKWWKKIFSPLPPNLVIMYSDNEIEKTLLFETTNFRYLPEIVIPSKQHQGSIL